MAENIQPGLTLNTEDHKDLEEEAKGDNKFHHHEKTIVVHFDSAAGFIAKKAGFHEVKWLTLTMVLLFI